MTSESAPGPVEEAARGRRARARILERIPVEPARRIATASAAIVILLAGAIGVTLWRYEAAIDRYQHARGSQSDAQSVQQAASAFWNEQAAIFAYSTQQNVSELQRLSEARQQFTS